jgi:hypothetical protein
MASNINPYNIDGTFPIANQDNSSQGFRDNFTNIRNNLIYAENEITDLQSKVLVTSALTGQTLTNDMAGTQILRPQLASWTQSLLDLGVIGTGSTAILDFNQANFQKIITAGSAGTISMSFSNWPASSGAGALGYGLMRIWFQVTDVSHTITMPASVDITINDVAGAVSNGNGTWTIKFDAPGNYVFDISSIDSGLNYLIFDVTRNRSTLRDPNLYFNDSVTTTPTLFVGYAQNGGGKSTLDLAIAGDQGQNIVSAMGSYNAVALGNLTLANITNATLDTGKIGGYTLTTARGNLSTGTITPVKSGDYLGYFNAVSYSGYAGTANVFQQMATMAFYATGSNVTYGLGANIAFFTSQDGEVAQHGVIQAVGIENDQSTTFYGNVTVNGNLTQAGGQVVTGYQYLAPSTTNFWANINPNVSRFIMDPTTTLAFGNITLPNVAIDGTIISVHSTAQITSFGANSRQSGTVVKPSTAFTLSAGTGVEYFYHASENTWYKIR